MPKGVHSLLESQTRGAERFSCGFVLSITIWGIIIRITIMHRNNTNNRSPQPEQQITKGITLMDPKIPLVKWKNGPHSLVNYVRRMLKPVVLRCAHNDPQFGLDDYIANQQVKSVLCMPILLKNTLKVYLLFHGRLKIWRSNFIVGGDVLGEQLVWQSLQ